MKHKRYLYILNPAEYALGEEPTFFLSILKPSVCDHDERVYISDFEVEINNAKNQVIKDKASGLLDEKEQRIRANFQADIDRLVDIRNKLLAITYQPQEN